MSTDIENIPNVNNLVLDEPINNLPQVSSARSKALYKLGIHTIRDLLNHFPFRYIDLTNVSTIQDSKSGNLYSVIGKVYDIVIKEPKPKLKIVEITLIDQTGTLIVSVFRSPWLINTIKKNYTIVVAGMVEFNFGFKRMTNPFIEILHKDSSSLEFDNNCSKINISTVKSNNIAKIISVYRANCDISSAWIRRLVKIALKYCRGIENFVPSDLCNRYKLLDVYDAYTKIHFPSKINEVANAKRTFKYFEIFLLQIYLHKKHYEIIQHKSATEHIIDGKVLSKLSSNLNFNLTSDQTASLSQILSIMSSKTPLNHLLFGEVGSGKTVISAMCMAVACDSKKQAMMMVPTEILANQHYRTLCKMFSNCDIRIEILRGSINTHKSADIIKDFHTGNIDILIGTHVLLNKSIVPDKCSFIVIDEMHRFGVEQKKKLIEKGNYFYDEKKYCADVLYMSATPIPRSLALTIYGDMTFSYLKQVPMGKNMRTTNVLYRDNSRAAYEGAFDALELGKQVFVICPLVGVSSEDRVLRASGNGYKKTSDPTGSIDYSVVVIDSEEDYQYDNVVAAKQHASLLQNKVFTNYNVGLLYGSMNNDEKNEVMRQFYNNEIQVLVCTTVVDVGIDVPNASVMIVEDADRFGLSQLHQLRGRVGRDGRPANIFLISNSKDKNTLNRLSALKHIDDGIKISEYDLSLRKEGDVLGNRQHGASILKLIKPQEDNAIIKTAYKDAKKILKNDHTLNDKSNILLSYEVSRTFT